MDIEPETELSEEEKRAKEKKVMEIKKMIALQSLQPMMMMNTNGGGGGDAVYSNGSSAGSSDLFGYYGHTNGNSSNGHQNNYLSEYSYEREKRAREQVNIILKKLFSLILI